MSSSADWFNLCDLFILLVIRPHLEFQGSRFGQFEIRWDHWIVPGCSDFHQLVNPLHYAAAFAGHRVVRAAAVLDCHLRFPHLYHQAGTL